jgi:hypothetical protein
MKESDSSNPSSAKSSAFGVTIYAYPNRYLTMRERYLYLSKPLLDWFGDVKDAPQITEEISNEL